MENTKKSFGEIWAELTSEQREYFKGYIDRQRQDAVKHYKAEQLRLHGVVKSSCNCYADQWDKREDNTIYCTGCGKDV